MKNANKFMVVPYDEKLKIDTKPKDKTTDAKISEILNNNKLQIQDKNRLINELIIQKQRNSNIEENLINKQNETIDENSENIDNNIDDYNENYDYVNEIFDFNNKTTTNQPRKSSSGLNSSIAKINKNLHMLNESIKNGHYKLPPGYSTRNETNKFIEPVKHISLEKRKKNRENQKHYREYENENPNPKTQAGKNVIAKLKSNALKEKKLKRKSLVDKNRALLNEKIKKKDQILNNTDLMDEDDNQQGNGWIFLKRNRKNI